jgi:hypothetical protein
MPRDNCAIAGTRLAQLDADIGPIAISQPPCHRPAARFPPCGSDRYAGCAPWPRRSAGRRGGALATIATSPESQPVVMGNGLIRVNSRADGLCLLVSTLISRETNLCRTDRLYFLNQANRITGADELDHDTDGQAIATARANAEGRRIEIWQRHRRVGVFEPFEPTTPVGSDWHRDRRPGGIGTRTDANLAV